MIEALPPFGRLRWLCRRGTRELDSILGGFLEDNYSAADIQTQHAFVALLSCQDPDIYDWLMGANRPPETHLAGIIELLQIKYGINGSEQNHDT